MTFFASIPKYKTLTGLEKVKVKNNTLDVIKEERQAFGILGFWTLRQQSIKTTLRGLLYEKSDLVVKEIPDEADWLVHTMAEVAVAPPQ